MARATRPNNRTSVHHFVRLPPHSFTCYKTHTSNSSAADEGHEPAIGEKLDRDSWVGQVGECFPGEEHDEQDGTNNKSGNHSC